MTGFEFFEILLSNLRLFAICILFSLALFYFVMKKTTSSWFNPLRFNLLTFTLGFGVILFLYFTDNMSFKTFNYTILSISIFWLTFMLIFKNKQRLVTLKFKGESQFVRYLFYLSYLIYISLTLLSYKLLGIPVFNEDSRIATYTGSGLGFIARILPVLQVYCLIYIMSLLNASKNRGSTLRILIYFVPVIIFGVLSGSRSSFLVIIFIFWGYKTFFKKEEPKLINHKIFLIPFFLVSIYVFSLSTGGNLNLAFLAFLERIVASGDLYWEALPNEVWKDVVIRNPFEFVFMGFLGPLRILDANYAEIPIGFQLTNIIYPAIEGKSTGPVALFPVFGLVCFGYYGGLVFSFLQALLVSSLLRFFYIKSNSIIVVAMAYYGFFNILALLGDISAGLGALLDVLIGYAFFLFLICLIVLFLYPRKNFF